MLIVPVNVSIVVIVTERFKEEMKKEINNALDIVNKMIEQVRNRRMVKVSEIFKGTLVEHISEKAKEQTTEEFREAHKKVSQRNVEDDFRLEYLSILKRNLERELKNIDNLKTGDEILFKNITGMTLVQPGINIKEALSTLILKVKDWKVVSISSASLTSEFIQKKIIKEITTEE